jgi:hypothetical protein
LGVRGNESELAERGNREGRVGIVNGMGEAEGDSSSASRGKMGDVGDAPGVFLRT